MTYTRGDIITTLLNKGKNRNYIAGYLTAVEGYETQDPEKTNKDYSKGYETGLKEINAWVNQD